MSDTAAKIAAMNLAQLKVLCAAASVELDSTPSKAEARKALEAADQAKVEAAIKALEKDAGGDSANADAEAPKARKWSVSLKHLPTHVVDAVDAADAIEQYKKHMGVIRSEHQFQADPVDESPAT